MRASVPNTLRLMQLCLVGLLFCSACTVGPFQVAYRPDNNPEANTVSDIASTVTAVFATNTHIAVLRTATAQAQPFIPTSEPVQPAPPSAIPGPPVPVGDIRLTYNEDAFTLTNTSGTTRDIAGLSFQSDRGALSVGEWDNGYLTAPLYAFPAGDCLMAWSVNTEGQPKPVDCRTRHSWIAIRDQQAFWRTDAAFTVYWNGQPIATCQGIAGTCPVTLP